MIYFSCQRLYLEICRCLGVVAATTSILVIFLLESGKETIIQPVNFFDFCIPPIPKKKGDNTEGGMNRQKWIGM